MTTTPPTKPPRGVKHGKETSGLLMSVIRTLSASETNEQRDREKAKLETEYKRSDRKLDELVAHHDQDLTQVMQLFTTLSGQVTTAREKIHAVKENLHACKTLLGCRRDELHKLWLEGVEHKYMLQLLEEIEQMNEVPTRFSAFLARKHYLHATKLLVSVVSLGKGTLNDVQGLRELSIELENKKQQLHIKLLEELQHHLYIRPGTEAVQLRRQGSGRDAILLSSPFQRDAEHRASARQRSETKARRNLLDISTAQAGLKSPEGSEEIEEDTKGDPEADPDNFVAILVECLAILERIPNAVETIKVEMQTELLAIIQRTTQQAIDYNTVQGQTVENGQQVILDLFETVFEQFRFVAKVHVALLQQFNRVVEKYHIDVQLYDLQDFWSKVQSVLQLLLTDYLDIQNTTTETMQQPVFTGSGDIAQYFSRKKTQSKKKGSMFKFDCSPHALTVNTYLKGDNVRPRDKVLVCTPNPNNIIFIFLPLMRFIEEIEQTFSNTSRNVCTLHQFLNDYVKDSFLVHRRSELVSCIESILRSSDCWKRVIAPDTLRELYLEKPVLQSTLSVENCMREWRDLMRAMPTHAERFAHVMADTLQNYRNHCHAEYRRIVQPRTDDRRVCSAAWLKDDDISRFLKSLPNWLNLKAQRELQNARSGRRRTATRKEQPVEEEESPADVRQRNLKEAEILASNLGEGGINAQEIISDMNLLKGLAQLQESMEWFSNCMRQFITELRNEPTIILPSDSIDSSATLSEQMLQALTGLTLDFDELSNTCLLVLHLEVRVQCFHYLLMQPLTSGGHGDSQEADPCVQELCHVLMAIDEIMTMTLQPSKCKYIFEGLGHLIAKRLISSSQFMDHIDEADIQRMCRNVFALQQTLTNITMSREVALDHARHFYEMFYMSPDEILSEVIEKGPEFSELEYCNAFQLLHRSHTNKEYSPVEVYFERLTNILGDVGVTV